MNFVFISPHFPENYEHFCECLNKNGVNVLGIGDAPWEKLSATLKNSLTEYYRVNSMGDYNEMLRAMGYFTFHYGKIDWVESNNEYWLEQDAQLRTDFNIKTGLKAAEINKYKSKSAMKAYYAQAGVPTARWHLADSLEKALAFAESVGWPIVAKPDKGVGASDTFKLHNEQEMTDFFASPQPEQYILEEYVDGEVVTFDGVAGPDAKAIYAASHVTPESIMDIVNEHTPLWYYVDTKITPQLRTAGEATLRVFGARNRFFHCEFFRMKSDKAGLGQKGDILGLEVNMRPAGGYTVDMMNFAGDVNLYQIWADMVAFGESRHPIAATHRRCCCTSRRDDTAYLYTHELILQQFADNIKMAPRLPAVIARAMGDQLYIACFDTDRQMQNFRRLVQARAEQY